MKKVIRLRLCIFTLMAFAFLCNTVSAQITAKADAAFNKAEYSKALYMYKKILSSEKLSVSAQSTIYHKIAKCYMGLNYYRPARHWFERMMLQNPNNTAIYPLYSEILRCNGNYLDALSYYYRYSAAVEDTMKLEKMRSMFLYPVGNNYQNPFVTVAGQYSINTFGKKRGLHFLNGKLFYSTTGYMLDPSASDYNDHINDYHVFRSDVSGKTLSNSLPVSDIPVFVRNKVLSFAVYPETKDIYFVALNKKGEPTLYISQFIDSTYSNKKEVRIGGKNLPVESLAFTSDGRKMIFSAYIEGKGSGNNDLWMSKLEGKNWQAPLIWVPKSTPKATRLRLSSAATPCFSRRTDKSRTTAVSTSTACRWTLPNPKCVTLRCRTTLLPTISVLCFRPMAMGASW